MSETVLSDYIFCAKTAQFRFFKIPHQLVSDPRFKCLSSDAKLLYGMLLDRMGLSAKNGWHDDTGRIYIYYTVKEICENIGCGRNKAMRLLAELDTVKGIGLIERIKQGQGKPDKIFVKIVTLRRILKNPSQRNLAPLHPFLRSTFPMSRSRKLRLPEVGKIDL